LWRRAAVEGFTGTPVRALGVVCRCTRNCSTCSRPIPSSGPAYPWTERNPRRSERTRCRRRWCWVFCPGRGGRVRTRRGGRSSDERRAQLSALRLRPR
jgi:hypothetical protein